MTLISINTLSFEFNHNCSEQANSRALVNKITLKLNIYGGSQIVAGL